MAPKALLVLLSWQTSEALLATSAGTGAGTSCRHCSRPVIRSTRPQMMMEATNLLSQPVLGSVLGAIDSFYRNSPVEAAALTCGAKAAASDTISQRRASLAALGFQNFCWSRNAVFTAYGAIYTGCVQHYLYNEVYPQIFGSSTSMATVLETVAFDNLVHAPLLCLPSLYLLKAVVFEQPLKEVGFRIRGSNRRRLSLFMPSLPPCLSCLLTQTAPAQSQGLSKYLADARGDLLLNYWAVWTPAQCLTFSVVPEHLRIPFVAFVSFFWLIILSTISSRDEAGAETPS